MNDIIPSQPEPGPSEAEVQTEAITDGANQVVDITRERIIHALTIFPFISGSMIHVAIGTSTSTKLFKPILEELITQGIVQKTDIQLKSPVDRWQTHSIYHLTENEYIYNKPTT